MAFASLHLMSPRALLPMMRRPWLQESIYATNYTALINVIDFAYDHPDATAAIAQMDFLATLEDEDIGIIQELLEWKWMTASVTRGLWMTRSCCESTSQPPSSPGRTTDGGVGANPAVTGFFR